MEPSGFNLEYILLQTKYAQDCLEKLSALLQTVHFSNKFIPKILLGGPDGCGKRVIAKAAAVSLGMKLQEQNVVDLLDDTISKTEERIRDCILNLSSLAPCFAYFSGLELLLCLEDRDIDRVQQCIRESLDTLANDLKKPIIFVATTHDFDRVDCSPLSCLFHHSISLVSPDNVQAKDIVRSILDALGIKNRDPSTILNKHCNEGEYFFGALVHACAIEELELLYPPKESSESLHDAKQQEQQEGSEGTRWLDIGGLSDVKQEMVDTVQLSIDYPQLRESGLRRTGILLYGPPGTGKTLLARAVATECSLSFITVNGPELLDQYVGQSEENVRRLFQRARDCSPSVIFFDEFDSLAPNRGQAGDSGGVMDRIVAQILAEMDGVGKGGDGSVFVIAATNRLDLIDPSFLRPGRFDKVLEVPLPSTKESRCQILEALTRKMQLADGVDLARLESICPRNMSGADFQGLCSKAQHKAIQRCIEQVESGLITEKDAQIIANMEDFVSSLETG